MWIGTRGKNQYRQCIFSKIENKFFSSEK